MATQTKLSDALMNAHVELISNCEHLQDLASDIACNESWSLVAELIHANKLLKEAIDFIEGNER